MEPDEQEVKELENVQPRPWHAEQGVELWRIVDVNGFAVLGNVTREEAELICAAVNSHTDEPQPCDQCAAYEHQITQMGQALEECERDYKALRDDVRRDGRL